MSPSATRFPVFCLALMLAGQTVFAQRQMEKLGRGVVAVGASSTQVYVGWRMLGTDPEDIGFKLYRVASGVTNVLNGGNLLTNTTDFVDSPPSLADANTYFVQPVINGVGQAYSGAYTLSANAPTQQYLAIPLTAPPGGTSPPSADGEDAGGPYTYTVNDCSAGDVDGDGEYEIILKWDPSNAKDNSQSGYTGDMYLDGYRLNGTRLWRIDFGPNIRAGAHYLDFMVYDFDGDGKAEVMCRTAPGSKDGLGAHFLYTQYVNRLHGRSGHLWQNRFFSCALDDEHLWAALVYVERNPVRARLVRKAWNYAWSSAAAHVGQASPPKLLDLGEWRRRWTAAKWRMQLVRVEDEEAGARLRLCTHRGRPLGTDRFVSKLERLLGRRLRALPVGRPRKQEKAKSVGKGRGKRET